MAGLALNQVGAADIPPVEQTSIEMPYAALAPTPEVENATGRVQVAEQQQANIVQLIKKAEERGHVRVIVGLKLPHGFTPEGNLPNPDAVERQRNDITAARNALVNSLQGYEATAYASWDSLPHVALRVSAAALRQLVGSQYVTTLQEDRADRPSAPQ